MRQAPPGSYGLLRLPGDKETDDTATPGLLPSEAVRFELEGMALLRDDFSWQPDYEIRMLNSALPSSRFYLPLMQK